MQKAITGKVVALTHVHTHTKGIMDKPPCPCPVDCFQAYLISQTTRLKKKSISKTLFQVLCYGIAITSILILDFSISRIYSTSAPHMFTEQMPFKLFIH